MKRFSKAAVIAVLFIFTASFFSCKSYPAAFKVNDYLNNDKSGVTYIDKGSYCLIKPAAMDGEDFSDKTVGIIFYPGGLVEHEAYLPLMEKLAQQGAVCILVEMPFDFAFMDYRAAGKFLKLYPVVEHWYMAGHSLGGAMAASYVSRHEEDFEGLILLAAYTNHNISDSGVKVLSIYGSNDGVLNFKRYNKNKKNLPAVRQGLTEIIIDGGNHAQFASYGKQKRDGKAEISADEQQEITAAEIAQWADIKTETEINPEAEIAVEAGL